MSTEQEDAVLLLELEEKITRRIREQIRKMLDGLYDSGTPAMVYGDNALDPGHMHNHLLTQVKINVLNDPQFITELTKRIGQRMNQIY